MFRAPLPRVNRFSDAANQQRPAYHQPPQLPAAEDPSTPPIIPFLSVIPEGAEKNMDTPTPLRGPTPSAAVTLPSTPASTVRASEPFNPPSRYHLTDPLRSHTQPGSVPGMSVQSDPSGEVPLDPGHRAVQRESSGAPTPTPAPRHRPRRGMVGRVLAVFGCMHSPRVVDSSSLVSAS